MVPLADFCGVQLYTVSLKYINIAIISLYQVVSKYILQYFGYFATYGTSLGFVILGINYVGRCICRIKDIKK